MAEAVVEVAGLTKTFGSSQHPFTAVDNVSFSIKEGEIVGLLGPNGAGKTTTIHMLLGVLLPTCGDIRYFGKALSSHRTEIMEKVNFSSTYIELPWRLSVYENLDVIARLYLVHDRKKRILELAEIFDARDLLDQKMGDLSAGQKTRIYLMKAFLNHPNVLLLDEPTASLDPDVADKIRTFLLRQRDVYKTSMLFTSHNMSEVEEVCDRVIFINHGKIIAEDTPASLAKTIKLSEVKFIISDGLKRAVELCRRFKWKTVAQDRVLTLYINQADVPYLLSTFAEHSIEYSDISIEKPTLEDYFLEVAKHA